MVSKVQPGQEALARMGIFRTISELGGRHTSYAGKFALAAFIVYLLLSRADWESMYPVLAALVLACFTGFLGTLWILRELLVPIDLTAQALRDYIDSR